MKKLKWEPACIICEKKDLFHSMQLRMNVLAKHEIPRSLLTAIRTYVVDVCSPPQISPNSRNVILSMECFLIKK